MNSAATTFTSPWSWAWLARSPARRRASSRRSCSASRSAALRSSCKRRTASPRPSGPTRSSRLSSPSAASCARTQRQAVGPVMASTRRTPAATPLSLVIKKKPMSPVRSTWVPPHSSMEKPGTSMTRTSSPYFSPKRAIAPSARARSKLVCRCPTAWFLRICWKTSSSTCRSSASLIALWCAKSKRIRSASTSEPFCVTCSPRTWRRAACSRWVAVWLSRIAARRAASTASSRWWPTCRLPSRTRTRCTHSSGRGRVVSRISTSRPGAKARPRSPTCPPLSP